MALISENEVRSFVPKRTQLFESSATRLKRSAVRTFTSTDSYDVFLSHAFKDAELVEGIKLFLESKGLKVYVDWIENPELDRSKVSPGTAEVLREAMRHSKTLIYAASVHAAESKWMPWELGFSDALHGKVAILPVAPANQLIQAYKGQEYLGIYPYVDEVGGLLQVKSQRIAGRQLTKDQWLILGNNYNQTVSVI
jgi:hypothetical protein